MLASSMLIDIFIILLFEKKKKICSFWGDFMRFTQWGYLSVGQHCLRYFAVEMRQTIHQLIIFTDSWWAYGSVFSVMMGRWIKTSFVLYQTTTGQLIKQRNLHLYINLYFVYVYTWKMSILSCIYVWISLAL